MSLEITCWTYNLFRDTLSIAAEKSYVILYSLLVFVILTKKMEQKNMPAV